MIRDFEYRKSDREIFENELKEYLPKTVYDSHVHLWAKENLKIASSEYAIHKVYKPWTDFDCIEEYLYEDYQFCVKEAFPGIDVRPLAFGSPFPQIDRDLTNAYLMDVSKRQAMPYYYIPGQYEDLFATEQKLHLSKQRYFLGLKPYPDIPVVKGREVSIYDMLNTSALAYANEHQLSLVLHIPRKGRLHSEENRRELLACITDYPKIRFIIAHVGRAFTYYDVEGLIDFLLPYENVWFDTALINSETVLTYLFQKAEPSRILFGSDAPVAFLRGKDVTINNQHYYVSEKSVPWGLGPAEGTLSAFTFYIYEEIRAMLYAAKFVYGNQVKSVLEQVFYQNAKRLLHR